MIAGLLGFCSTILFVTCFQYEFLWRRFWFAVGLMVLAAFFMDGANYSLSANRWD